MENLFHSVFSTKLKNMYFYIPLYLLFKKWTNIILKVFLGFILVFFLFHLVFHIDLRIFYITLEDLILNLVVTIKKSLIVFVDKKVIAPINQENKISELVLSSKEKETNSSTLWFYGIVIVCVIVITVWYFSASTPAPGGNNGGNGQIPPAMPPQVNVDVIAPQIPINPEAPVGKLTHNLAESFNRRPQTGWDVLGVARPSTPPAVAPGDMPGEPALGSTPKVPAVAPRTTPTITPDVGSGGTPKVPAVAPRTTPTITPDVGSGSTLRSSEFDSHNMIRGCEVIDVEGFKFSGKIKSLIESLTDEFGFQRGKFEELLYKRILNFDQIVERASTFSAELSQISDTPTYITRLQALIDENVILNAIISIADWLETITVKEGLTSLVFFQNCSIPVLGFYITAVFIVKEGRAVLVRFMYKCSCVLESVSKKFKEAMRSCINLMNIRLQSIRQNVPLKTFLQEFVQLYKNVPAEFLYFIWVYRFRILIFKLLNIKELTLSEKAELTVLLVVAKNNINKSIAPCEDIIKELKDLLRNLGNTF